MISTFVRSLLQKVAQQFRTVTIMRDVPAPIGDGTTIREPYLYRSYIMRSASWGSLFLHRIIASDRGPEIHNHPWALSVSLILLGGYTEERCVGFAGLVPVTRFRKLRPLRLNIIRADDYHRLVIEPGQEAWTLFYHTPTRVQNWGFLYKNGDFEPVLQRSDAQEGNVVLPRVDPGDED